MNPFTTHLREMVGATPQKEVQDHAAEMREALKALMSNHNAVFLLEMLEGMHAEDYRAIRSAETERVADRVRGQAARTDELLAILRGATTPVAIPRRRR